MKNAKTVLLAASALLMSLVPLVAFHAQHNYHQLMAGLGALLFLFASQELNRSILEESVHRKGKAYRDFIETLGLFLVITGGMVADIVPTNLSIGVLMAIGVSKIYCMELSKRFRQRFSFRLGEKIWVAIIGTVYLLSYSNAYFLFYGYLLLLAVMAYDLMGLFLELRERNRV